MSMAYTSCEGLFSGQGHFAVQDAVAVDHGSDADLHVLQIGGVLYTPGIRAETPSARLELAKQRSLVILQPKDIRQG
jgi:hypothetical protein